jgi:hypothetical protein
VVVDIGTAGLDGGDGGREGRESCKKLHFVWQCCVERRDSWVGRHRAVRLARRTNESNEARRSEHFL